MNSLDVVTVRFVDGFTSRSCLFDGAVRYLQGTPMLKGVVLFAFVWWALHSKDTAPERRDRLLAVVLLSVPALLVARLLALVLPFRARPIHDAAFGLRPACGFEAPRLETWSSFPSDHAVLYCMLATGVWLASPRLGALAMSYVGVFVLLPRVYLGLHWPTDVLAGAALGVASAHLGARVWTRSWAGRCTESLRTRVPGLFHATLFVWSYLLATNFDELRRLGEHTLTALRATALP